MIAPERWKRLHPVRDVGASLSDASEGELVRREMMERNEPDTRIRDILRACPLFLEVPVRDLDRIAASCQLFRTYRGQTLMEEGDEDNDVFLILSGRATVSVESISPFIQVSLSRLNPGEVAGEMSLVSDDVRSATVVAETPGDVLQVKGEELKAMMKDDPQFGYLMMRNVASILSRRVRQMNRRLTNLVKGPYFQTEEG
ncbi:MAG: Crp/Fnr family transcriptional regulator [Sumerlaeia bacterium]